MQFFRWVAVGVGVAVVGCGSDSSNDSPVAAPASSADEIEVVPFATTKMLGADDVASLTAAVDGTLVFAKAPAALSTIAEGEVIVAGLNASTPQGLLRVVRTVKRDGDRLELATMHAPVQLAFQKLHVKLERTIDDISSAGAPVTNDIAPKSLRVRDLVSADPSKTLPIDYILFDGDGDSSTKNDQISVKGTVGGGVKFGISIDVDWGAVFDIGSAVKSCVASALKIFSGQPPDCSLTALLPEVKVNFNTDPHLASNVKVEGAASFSYSKDIDILSITASPFAIGPLVFVPTVDITAKIEGGAAAGFTMAAHGNIGVATGVQISSKHVGTPNLIPLTVTDKQFGADETQVTLAAHAKTGLGARLNLQLYGIAGPYVEARTYAEVKADLTQNPCWNLHVGLEGALGFRVTTPVIPIIGAVTLIDWKSGPLTAFDETVTSGTCLPNTKGPPLPPGSGPDALTYATPSFAQWAHVFEDTGTDGTIHAVIDDHREWNDSLFAIDQRWVTVGRHTDSVIKYDDTGKPIWAHRYRRDPLAPVMNVIRAVNTQDAAIMLLTEANDGDGPGLMKVGQAGGVYFRKRIASTPTCSFEPTRLVADNGTGFWVLGECLGNQRFAVMHVDQDANPIATRLIEEPGGQRSVSPLSIALSSSGKVTVLGYSSTVADGVSMFAVRLSDSGPLEWSNRYVGCAGYLDLFPDSAKVDVNDGVTFTGSAADHRSGLLGRIKANGDLGFANFPNVGDTKDSFPMPINAFAELPTTGFLVVGSTKDFFAEAGTPATQSSLVVANLDLVGRPLWAKTYTLANRSIAFGGMHLTDDGGAMVVGATEHVGAGRAGTIAMKMFAKDGALGQAAANAGITVVDTALVAPECAVSTVGWMPSVTEAAFSTEAGPTFRE